MFTLDSYADKIITSSLIRGFWLNRNGVSTSAIHDEFLISMAKEGAVLKHRYTKASQDLWQTSVG
jgi:hypothetical protein